MAGNQFDGFQHLTFSVSGETYLYGRLDQNTVVRVIAADGEDLLSARGELRASIRTIAKTCRTSQWLQYFENACTDTQKRQLGSLTGVDGAKNAPRI